MLGKAMLDDIEERTEIERPIRKCDSYYNVFISTLYIPLPQLNPSTPSMQNNLTPTKCKKDLASVFRQYHENTA